MSRETKQLEKMAGEMCSKYMESEDNNNSKRSTKGRVPLSKTALYIATGAAIGLTVAIGGPSIYKAFADVVYANLEVEKAETKSNEDLMRLPMDDNNEKDSDQTPSENKIEDKVNDNSKKNYDKKLEDYNPDPFVAKYFKGLMLSASDVYTNNKLPCDLRNDEITTSIVNAVYGQTQTINYIENFENIDLDSEESREEAFKKICGFLERKDTSLFDTDEANQYICERVKELKEIDTSKIRDEAIKDEDIAKAEYFSQKVGKGEWVVLGDEIYEYSQGGNK